MLVEEIKNIKSEKSDLRKFGITFFIVLGLLGGALWWRGKEYYTIFAVLSLLFLAAGIFVPVILKPVQKAWMALAVVLGWFMTRLILSVLFYVIFTCIGLIGKIVGKKFLDLKIDDNTESYWIKRPTGSVEPERYEKQF
jgi:hypothetical protein